MAQVHPTAVVHPDAQLHETVEVGAFAVIGAIVNLGRALGMGIVAEGVENIEQAELLMDLGCTHLQGYLFGCPQSQPDLDSRLPPSLSIPAHSSGR